MKNLQGKVVLITGASAGIGRAAAKAFDLSGARLALAARRGQVLKDLAQGFNEAIVLPTDLADADQTRRMVEETVKRFGRLDVLINNAAMVHFSRSSAISLEVMRKAFAVNVLAPLAAIQQAAKIMRQQGGGHIINVGSPGFLIGVPFLAPYMSTKAALYGLTRTLQAEWEGSNIVLTEYLPGYVLTESQAESDFGRLGQDVFEDPDQNWLLRRLARPQSAEKVARDLVMAVHRPKRVIYSSLNVQFGVWLANLSRFRRSTGTRMTRTFCRRLGISAFEEDSSERKI